MSIHIVSERVLINEYKFHHLSYCKINVHEFRQSEGLTTHLP